MSVKGEILEIIQTMPGVSFNEIADLMSHAPKGSVASALHSLYVKGEIARDSAPNPNYDGKTRGARPLTSVYTINASHTPPPPKHLTKQTPPKVKPAGLEARIRVLEAELEELRAWKAEALNRFPDLAVPPVVFRARKIVARLLREGGDGHLADEVLAGRKDGNLHMRATVEALSLSDA